MRRPTPKDFYDSGQTDWDDFEAHETAYEDAEDELYERKKIEAHVDGALRTVKHGNLELVVPAGKTAEQVVREFDEKMARRNNRISRHLTKGYKRKLSKVKTVADINKEIEDINEECFMPDGRYKVGLGDKRKKNLTERMRLLRTCIMYLEQCEPTEEILRRDMATVEREMKVIDAGYLDWLAINKQVCMKYKDPKAFYLEKMGLSDLRHKLKTYQYLLS